MIKKLWSLFLVLALIAGPLSHYTKVFASTAGPNNPGTLSDDNAVGTFTWSNPSNASSSNDVYATAGALFGDQTHYLKATNFSFSVTSGATINGVKVEIEAISTPNTLTGPSWTVVKLVKGGTVSGNNKGTGNMPTAETYTTFGSTSDLWGLSLTDSDVNASNFGVVVSVTDITFAGPTAKIDHIRITITYTVASGGAPPRRVILSRSAGTYSHWAPSTNYLYITRRTDEETNSTARALTLPELLELDYLRPRKIRFSNDSFVGCC